MLPSDAVLWGLNALDFAVILLMLLMARAGYRAGLIAGIAGWLGVFAGVGLFVWFAPPVLGSFDSGSPTVRLLIAALLLFLLATVSAAVAQQIGRRLTNAVNQSGLTTVNRLTGMAGAVAMFGLILWLLLPAAAFVPGTVSAQVRQSTVFSLLQTRTPDAPQALAALGNLIDVSRFPDVFTDLRPAPDTGSAPAEIAVSSGIVAQATAATVQVQSVGCGGLFYGSGFTVGDGQVVTNAHVVAGADEVTVRRTDGTTHAATVVRFDAKRDLAVLAVNNLGLAALTFGPVVDGSDAVAIGYPGGQVEPRVAAVTVRQQRATVGRDIYRDEPAAREVVFLAATLRRGDSGAPVVDVDGHVVGVVFAVSPDRSSTAYALAPEEVEAVLAGPAVTGAGRCL